MRSLVAATLLLMGCTTPLAAQVYSVDGSCKSLKVGAQDLTSDCKPNVANVAPNPNSISFFFGLQQGGYVEFMGAEGPKPSDSSNIVNLREVVLKALPGSRSDETKKVSGMCLHDNPNAPDPRIVCSATSTDGEVFAAEFKVIRGSVSDMMKPKAGQKPAQDLQPKDGMRQGYDVSDEDIASVEARKTSQLLSIKTIKICNESKRGINVSTYRNTTSGLTIRITSS